MKKIKKYVEQINDELKSAKEYAEKSLDYKAHGDTSTASKFKEMANDELRHADTLHENAVKEIETLSRVYTAPVEMQEKLDAEHKKYVEEATFIRTMLQM